MSVVHDTLVMANLGYFQLKATPGAWNLRLRSGRSADIFQFAQVTGADTHSPSSSRPVILVHDLGATYVSVSVSRRAGMEQAQLLDGDDADTVGTAQQQQRKDGEGSSLWDSLKKLVPGSGSGEEESGGAGDDLRRGESGVAPAADTTAR